MKSPTVAVLAAAMLFAPTLRLPAENWPQWRGPSFNGATTETNLPGDGLSSNQIVWTTAMPGPGAATPVVWGDRIFVTSGDKATSEVVALGINARDGHVAWRQPLSANHRSEMDNDMAAPSPVTDGKTVWFLTGNGALAAFTRDGEPVWKRDLAKDYGAFAIFFGYSSSPLLYEGKLYVLALQNEKPPGGQDAAAQGPYESYLLALDPATGKTLWRQVRPTDAKGQSRESYVTPYPMTWNGRKEIVLAGGECVTGHDLASGAETWRWWYSPTNRASSTQHVVPTPVAEDGLLYVVRPEHRPLFALRAGGSGLMSDDHVAWSFEKNKCWISSPLVYRGRLYVPQEEQGTLVCLDLKSGNVVWQNKLSAKGKMQTSPTGADGKVYLLSMSGEVEVLAAGDEFHELAMLKLDDSALCRSTVVAANGKLFVRTVQGLYCLSADTAKTTK